MATGRARHLIVAVLFVLSLRPVEAAQRAGGADLVLRNGAVYTVDASRSWASAIAVSGGRIVYVGPESGVRRWISPRTTTIDLGGRMVLPGFHDAHVHPVTSGIDLGDCYLNDAADQKAVLDTIRRYAAENPGQSWIRGQGWQLPIFPNANPHRTLLDQVVPDRPVLLYAADGHSAWANTRALKMAGVTAATPDPPNGRIERDASGEPSGTLRERASDLVDRLLPPRSPEEHRAGLRRALALANGFGITSMTEANASSDSTLDAYADLDRRGELTARMTAALRVRPELGRAQIPRLVELRRRYRTAHLRAIQTKIFVDGVIEAHTAALLAPYVDTPGDSGPANAEPGALNDLVTALDANGFQVHCHAIGDRATRMALDAFERARTANGPRDSRHQIAHIQIISPEDMPRFRRLGVVANFQPLWAYRDTYITELTEPVLGPERSTRIYQIGTAVRSGAVVACGSDWSVSSINPLDAIQTAITRRGLTEAAGPAWLPNETVDLATMLACYTINNAWASFQDRETGSIEVGKYADLIVLDRNLFEIPATEIHDAKVLVTLLGGREVFRDASFPATTRRPQAKR